jgi:hypothetical protein
MGHVCAQSLELDMPCWERAALDVGCALTSTSCAVPLKGMRRDGRSEACSGIWWQLPIAVPCVTAHACRSHLCEIGPSQHYTHLCSSTLYLLLFCCNGNAVHSETQLHDAEVHRTPFVKSRLPWHCLWIDSHCLWTHTLETQCWRSTGSHEENLKAPLAESKVHTWMKRKTLWCMLNMTEGRKGMHRYL